MKVVDKGSTKFRLKLLRKRIKCEEGSVEYEV